MGMVQKVTNTYSNPVSKMLGAIADSIPNYTWSVNGSGANRADILIGLKRLGYSKAELKNLSMDELYNNLKYSNPVLLRAYNNGGYNGGHIWFCDGYYEAKVQYTHRKKKWFKWTTHCTWVEYHDMLYMNWGWDGNHNGWYRSDNSENWNPGKFNLNYQQQMFVNLYPIY